jgi:UDP-glucose 4-epimerase
MKIFITGGAGFIGSTLADRLLDRGDQVLVLDNYETGRRDNLTEQTNLRVVEGTITDSALVHSLMQEFSPDLVVHAAASYKDPDNWEGDAATNALGTAIVVQATQAAGCNRLIYFQTALCYGTRPVEQPVTLGHHLDPDSSYAISKTAGELYIRLSNLDWVSFRLANAYGPRNLSGPLPTFFSRLDTGKPCFVMDTRRDFVFVDDMVDAAMMAVDGTGHGTYHLSSGGDVSIKELFDETVHALGIKLETPVEVRPRGADDAFTILLDPSRTQADFGGWTPATPLTEGVARAIEYYRKYGIEATFTHLSLPPDES